MQVAYSNLQILTAALQQILTDSKADRKKTVHYAARAKASVAAVVNQFAALRDLLAGSARGYMYLYSFQSRVLAGEEMKTLRNRMLSELDQVLCSSLYLPLPLQMILNVFMVLAEWVISFPHAVVGSLWFCAG